MLYEISFTVIMNSESLLTWRHGYLLTLGAVYHHEQLAADGGGGEQLWVGALSEVGLVQTLDGGGVAAVIVPPTVLGIRNDGGRVVSAKFLQNHCKIRTNILRHLIFKLHVKSHSVAECES